MESKRPLQLNLENSAIRPAMFTSIEGSNVVAFADERLLAEILRVEELSDQGREPANPENGLDIIKLWHPA
jgi:hypothetical protein